MPYNWGSGTDCFLGKSSCKLGGDHICWFVIYEPFAAGTTPCNPSATVNAFKPTTERVHLIHLHISSICKESFYVRVLTWNAFISNAC